MSDCKTLLFIDNTYPKAYQVSTLSSQAIGGTESSVIRTAQILSTIHNVYVAQKFRKNLTKESGKLSFIPIDEINKIKADYVIVLRKYPLLSNMKKLFPHAKLFLWLHTYKNIEYIFKRPVLAKTSTTIICNSETHKTTIDSLLNKGILGWLFSLFSKSIKVKYCYNPIDKPQISHNNRDINKLLFFSSPNKGLNQVIETFEKINSIKKNLKLYVANPGYQADKTLKENKNIIQLGSLPYNKLMGHVSNSLCVFYPQNSFAETFGLIYAEANALGTVVLAHDIGSAKEILDVKNPIIDATDHEGIIKLIENLQKSYPVVKYNQKFSKHNILKQWQKLIDL